MFLRELFEAPKKVAVAAFGRMNPPTIGHEKLVDKVKSYEGDHYIFLSQTVKPKDNPLPFDVKLEFAKKFFPGVNVGHPSVRTPIQMLQMLEKLGYTDVIYVAGSDRVASFDKLFNDYNGKEYNFNSITVENAGERDPDADGAEGMSASKMRAAAASGDYDSFAQGVPTPALAEKLYDAVRNGMGIKDKEPVEGLDEQQLNEAFPLLIPALAAAVRIGAPMVGRMLTSQGAKQAAKVVAKNTGNVAKATGKAVIKNPGKTALAVGGYEVYDTVSDAMDWLKELDVAEELIKPLAQAMIKYALPVAAVLAILYGGKKLYDYIQDDSDNKQPAQEGIRPEKPSKSSEELIAMGYAPDSDKVQRAREYEDWADDQRAKGKEIDEILGFATKSPKRNVVKRRPPEPEEDSVKDKLAKRRAMAAKGNPKAYKSGSLDG